MVFLYEGIPGVEITFLKAAETTNVKDVLNEDGARCNPWYRNRTWMKYNQMLRFGNGEKLCRSDGNVS